MTRLAAYGGLIGLLLDGKWGERDEKGINSILLSELPSEQVSRCGQAPQAVRGQGV